MGEQVKAGLATPSFGCAALPEFSAMRCVPLPPAGGEGGGGEGGVGWVWYTRDNSGAREERRGGGGVGERWGKAARTTAHAGTVDGLIVEQSRPPLPMSFRATDVCTTNQYSYIAVI